MNMVDAVSTGLTIIDLIRKAYATSQNAEKSRKQCRRLGERFYDLIEPIKHLIESPAAGSHGDALQRLFSLMMEINTFMSTFEPGEGVIGSLKLIAHRDKDKEQFDYFNERLNQSIQDFVLQIDSLSQQQQDRGGY